MKIEHLESSLKMRNLHFRHCSIERKPEITSGELNVDLSKEIEKIAEHDYSVTLQLSASNEDIRLLIVANAQFHYEGKDGTREDKIVQNNTVAIIYPYVRSQVTLMTSQPGMNPIVLPPINTTKLN